MPNLKILYNRKDKSKPFDPSKDIPIHLSLYLCLLIESIGLFLSISNLVRSSYFDQQFKNTIECLYILMSLPIMASTI